MATNFGVVWDNESERPGKNFVYTQYFEDCVNVKVCLASTLFADDTFVILDRGYALLQRCTKDNLLFLSFFARSKRSDGEPDFIIPVGVIAAMECAQATLENGSMKMGHMEITTHATVDYRLTLGPIKVTIFMSFSGMQSLKNALFVATQTFPNQHYKAMVVIPQQSPTPASCAGKGGPAAKGEN